MQGCRDALGDLKFSNCLKLREIDGNKFKGLHAPVEGVLRKSQRGQQWVSVNHESSSRGTQCFDS
jgi:hypothetical protein